MIDTALEYKVVFVTGANHGIGAPVATAFVKDGVRVYINYLCLSPKKYGQVSQDEA